MPVRNPDLHKNDSVRLHATSLFNTVTVPHLTMYVLTTIISNIVADTVLHATHRDTSVCNSYNICRKDNLKSTFDNSPILRYRNVIRSCLPPPHTRAMDSPNFPRGAGVKSPLLPGCCSHELCRSCAAACMQAVLEAERVFVLVRCVSKHWNRSLLFVKHLEAGSKWDYSITLHVVL
jgi:hypothetical protein